VVLLLQHPTGWHIALPSGYAMRNTVPLEYQANVYLGSTLWSSVSPASSLVVVLECINCNPERAWRARVHPIEPLALPQWGARAQVLRACKGIRWEPGRRAPGAGRRGMASGGGSARAGLARRIHHRLEAPDAHAPARRFRATHESVSLRCCCW